MNQYTYIGILEFQDNSGEYHNFEVMRDGNSLVFGGACNVGFLESGRLELESYESTDAGLEELLADLEVYYNDGASYVSRITCNERM